MQLAAGAADDDFDWYLLARSGRSYGPYPRELVERLVAQSEVLPDTPVWHPGLADWNRADRILTFPATEAAPRQAVPSLTPSPRATGRAEPPPPPRVAKGKPRPVATATRATAPAAISVPTDTQIAQRVLASIFDLLLVATVLTFLRSTVLADAPPWFGSRAVTLLVWALADGWLLAKVGSTPGRLLLGVTVRDAAGGRLDDRRSLLRSAVLPAALVAASLAPVFGFFAIVLLGFAWQRLRAGQGLPWDRLAGGVATYAALSSARRVLAGVAFVALFLVWTALRRQS